MKNIMKKSPVLFLIIPLVVLSACVSPWAKQIATMKTTWQSETPSLQFTIGANDYTGSFGSAITSDGEDVEIYFSWNFTGADFHIYLTNSETDLEKITTEENIALYGSYKYHSKKDNQVKLTIRTELYSDKLFNGLYDSIILTAMQ